MLLKLIMYAAPIGVYFSTCSGPVEGGAMQNPSTGWASVKRDSDAILIDLALQGGGAHGAFTWGVLDRLLEEPRLRIEGISGTSAGAMNADVLAEGHAATGEPQAGGQHWRNSGVGCLMQQGSAPFSAL